MPTTTRQQDGTAPTPALASRAKTSPGNAPLPRSHRASATDCTQHWEDAEHLEQNKALFQEFRKASSASTSTSTSTSSSTSSSSSHTAAASTHTGSGGGDHGNVPNGMKRGRGANQAGNTSKKPKSGEPKDEHEHDPAALPKGDKTRVPRVGQWVFWRAGEGEGEGEEEAWTEGDVKEVLYQEKVVRGQKAQASREDPLLVMQTQGQGGREEVRRPEDVWFD